MKSIPMEIEAVISNNLNDDTLIILKPAEGYEIDYPYKLPLTVTQHVANTLFSMSLRSFQNSSSIYRVLKNMLLSLHARIENIELSSIMVNDILGQISYIDHEGDTLRIPCSPSDALLLSVVCEMDIHCSESVLEGAGITDFEAVYKGSIEDEVTLFSKEIEDINPEDLFN